MYVIYKFDDSRGRPADVVIRTLDGRNIAFEVFMTGEDKEVKGIVQDVNLFDQVIACAPDTGSLESLRARVVNALDADSLKKVTFSLISQYLTVEEANEKNTVTSTPTPSKTPPSKPKEKPGKTADQVLIPPLELEKSRAKLELEPEVRTSQRDKRSKRERKPKTPLTKQIEDAYTHLHDLDWLRESELTRLPEVQERANPMQTMPEAQALREILLEAARQVLKDIQSMPDKANAHYFLEEYLKGKSVAQIARELGVTRSWCSRAYRKEAFELARMQLIKLISAGNS